MRLLKLDNNSEISLKKDLTDKFPAYGMLSHTWGDEDDEVTFQDFKNNLAKKKVGFKKIRFCAEQANQDGLRYFWID
ncbi:hypothetical protein EV356DRAFT_425568, partial [Viridothelium virens]